MTGHAPHAAYVHVSVKREPLRMADPNKSTDDPKSKEQKPKEPFEQTDTAPDRGDKLKNDRQRRGNKAGVGPTNPV